MKKKKKKKRERKKKLTHEEICHMSFTEIREYYNLELI